MVISRWGQKMGTGRWGLEYYSFDLFTTLHTGGVKSLEIFLRTNIWRLLSASLVNKKKRLK
jgi:hypothetical protein